MLGQLVLHSLMVINIGMLGSMQLRQGLHRLSKLDQCSLEIKMLDLHKMGRLVSCNMVYNLYSNSKDHNLCQNSMDHYKSCMNCMDFSYTRMNYNMDHKDCKLILDQVSLLVEELDLLLLAEELVQLVLMELVQQGLVQQELLVLQELRSLNYHRRHMSLTLVLVSIKRFQLIPSRDHRQYMNHQLQK